MNYFVTAGDVFRDMVRRYPSANDAAYWQYHVGESYYAAQQFEKAIEEYEKVRAVNKTHKSAAESLYAISTCAQLLSEAAEKEGDTEARQRWYDRLFEANEALVAEYPNSQYTADALINIGNKHYNSGSEQGVEEADRIGFYQMAIEHYQRAIDTPGIGNESKSTALNYLNDTANALTFYEYEVATNLLNEAKLARGEEQKPAIEAAIAAYSQIIENYPTTKYADLGLVQIGEAYMVLADSDDIYFNDALDYFNRLWAKYETTPPVDTKVNQALTYAISQIQTIQSYMRANNLQIRGEAAGGGGGGGE